MEAQAETAWAAAGRADHLGPARVVDTEGERPLVVIDGGCVPAAVALPGYRPTVGDSALVIGNAQGELYIIGVLARASGTTRFTVEEGDLEFVTARGRTRFVSEGGIELTSARTVEIRSRLGTVLSALGRAGRRLPWLSVGPERTELRNGELRMEADTIHQRSDTSRVDADRMCVSAQEVDVDTKAARLSAETLFSRVRNAYARVAGLWQVTAGRARTVVRGTVHQKAERIYSKADKDVKVKADQIHLG